MPSPKSHRYTRCTAWDGVSLPIPSNVTGSSSTTVSPSTVVTEGGTLTTVMLRVSVTSAPWGSRTVSLADSTPTSPNCRETIGLGVASVL